MKTTSPRTCYARITGLFIGTLVLLFLVSVSTVSAQNKKMKKTMASPRERAEKAVSYWNKHLSLTGEQQGQFKNLLAEEFTKQDSIRSSVKDRNAMSEAMVKLRDETHAKMETVLTPEQHQKFVSMRSTANKGKASVQKMKKNTKWNKTKPSKAPADTTGNN